VLALQEAQLCELTERVKLQDEMLDAIASGICVKRIA